MSKYVGSHQWNYLKSRDEQYKERLKAEEEAANAVSRANEYPSQIPTASNEVLLKLVLDLNERVDALQRSHDAIVVPTIGKRND